jgi:hypothetical protein
MPTSGYLSQSLRRPLPTKDDGILRTVADAAGYMMALSTDRQRAHWQRAARLILDEAHADDLSRQVEFALFYDRQLDLRSRRLESGESSTMQREFRRRLTVGAAHRAVSAANGRVSPEAQLIGRPALSAPD